MERSSLRYLVVLLLVMGVLTGGQKAWEQSVKLGCLPTDGVKPADGWMDDCSSDLIGDYDHSAIWFGTEPTIAGAVAAAKVLFFGDSRMLAAMSEPSVPAWFAARNMPFYLLAFTFGEQSGWGQRLLEKFQPHPAVMVFDTDPYFTGGQSLPAQAIESDPAGELKVALATKAFMNHAESYCGYVPWLCGRTASSYRSYQDGHLFSQDRDRVWFGGRASERYPITPPPPADTSNYDEYLGHARELLAKASIKPGCVVFTLIPNNDRDDSLARFLADRLGARVISPRIQGLSTVDRRHLSPESARVWAAAFFSELSPVLQDCLRPQEQQAVQLRR